MGPPVPEDMLQPAHSAFKKEINPASGDLTSAGFAKPVNPNATLDTLAYPADDVRRPR